MQKDFGDTAWCQLDGGIYGTISGIGYVLYMVSLMEVPYDQIKFEVCCEQRWEKLRFVKRCPWGQEKAHAAGSCAIKTTYNFQKASFGAKQQSLRQGPRPPKVERSSV